MKPSLSRNDQVRVLQGGDTLYFIASVNVGNVRLVNICKVGDDQILKDVQTDQLILDKPFLLRKISAILEIKKAKTDSTEILTQLLEKSNTYMAACETLSPEKLIEVNSAVIEWQGFTPIVSDNELNDFLKQNH